MLSVITYHIIYFVILYCCNSLDTVVFQNKDFILSGKRYKAILEYYIINLFLLIVIKLNT